MTESVFVPRQANTWQSCTMCSMPLKRPHTSVYNPTTIEYFRVCDTCCNNLTDSINLAVSLSKELD